MLLIVSLMLFTIRNTICLRESKEITNSVETGPVFTDEVTEESWGGDWSGTETSFKVKGLLLNELSADIWESPSHQSMLEFKFDLQQLDFLSTSTPDTHLVVIRIRAGINSCFSSMWHNLKWVLTLSDHHSQTYINVLLGQCLHN